MVELETKTGKEISQEIEFLLDESYAKAIVLEEKRYVPLESHEAAMKARETAWKTHDDFIQNELLIIQARDAKLREAVDKKRFERRNVLITNTRERYVKMGWLEALDWFEDALLLLGGE